MNKKQVRISLIISTMFAILVAFAGSQNGKNFNDLPIFGICVGVAFLINWLAFLPAYFLQTEKFFDLIGSLTYISVIILAIFLSDKFDNRSLLLASLVMIWAIRLGSFLFMRIHKSGGDDRFDSIKPDFWRFLNTWTLQALWVTLTASAALIAISSLSQKEIGVFVLVGGIVWLIGFIIEVVADYQKTQFKNNPKNDGKFISTGLWSKSRHPNYFGEIVLWIGILIIAIPVLEGWQWIALISPIFVTLLLTKISGIPMLERKADKKWGGQEDYEKYKKETPILIPQL